MSALAQGRCFGSKSGYHTQHPDNLVIFNANIFTKSRRKIWWGDLDITLDGDALKTMAAEYGEELYILWERDGRWDHQDNPDLTRAVAIVTVDVVTIC